MDKALQRYKDAKARGRNSKTPATNTLLVWWEHMETEHGATPGEWGNNTLRWHERNHPNCTTLPPYKEAKQVDYEEARRV